MFRSGVDESKGMHIINSSRCYLKKKKKCSFLKESKLGNRKDGGGGRVGGGRDYGSVSSPETL